VSFLLWLMNLLGIRPEDMLLTGLLLIGGAFFLLLVLLFAWADKHSKKDDE